MNINVLKPKYRTDEVLDSIKSCLETGWTGMGNKTVEFENVWKRSTLFNNALFVNSATSGLHLAVNVFKKIYGWDVGDEIITTPLTFVSTNHAILYEGLTPVFADVDEQLCLDPASVEKYITPKTKAVMFVGLGGNIGQYYAILKICKYHNLKLILDASHMAGTLINTMIESFESGDRSTRMIETQAGFDADATIFSFQAVKNLPTADAGMVCFDNKECDTLARQVSWLGIDKDTFIRTNDKGSYKWDYDVPNIGFKYNGNSIMASIALTQLKYLQEDNSYRRGLVVLYENHLKNIDKIKLVSHNTECKSARHLFQIEIDNREDFLEYMYSNEIYPGVHYKSNKLYPMYKDCVGSTPYADRIHTRLVSLPLHLGLSTDDVFNICKLIKKYYE